MVNASPAGRCRVMKKSYHNLAYASSVGFAMVLAVFGGLFFGRWLDNQMKTTPFFTFLFLLMGIGAGFRSLYTLIKKYFKDEENIIRSVKSEPHRKRPLLEKT
jgi:ATP synthase protein I